MNRALGMVVLLSLAGCSPASELDTLWTLLITDAGNTDAGIADAGSTDAGIADAGIADAGQGPADSGTADAGAPDAGRADAGILDAGLPDAGLVDAGSRDAGPCLNTWCQVFPITGAQTLHGCHRVSTGLGFPEMWAVGEGGRIVRLVGGGWTGFDAGTTSRFTDVWSPDAGQIIAVGDGVIGQLASGTWTLLDAGVSLKAVWGRSWTEAWAAGEQGSLLFWNGSTWLSIDAGTSEDLVSGVAPAPGALWLATRDSFLRWDGASWTTELPDAGLVERLTWDRYTPGHLWAVGKEGLVLHRSPDAGWERIDAGTSEDLHDAYVEGFLQVFVGDRGTLVEATYNAPLLAPVQGLPTDVDLFAVNSSSNPSLWAVGSNGRRFSRDFRGWTEDTTTDVGPTVRRFAGTRGDLWAAGHAVLHDDGSGWQPVPNPPGLVTGVGIADMWRADAQNLFFVGNRGLFVHWDSGTWRVVPGTFVSDTFSTVTGTSPTDVWVGGDYVIAHWDGQNLVRVPNVNLSVTTMLALSPVKVFAFGRNGRALLWDGQQWAAQTLAVTNSTDWTHSATENANLAWAVGSNHSIHRWDGTLWNPIVQPSTLPTVFAVWPNGPSDVYFAGNGFAPTVEHWDGVRLSAVPAHALMRRVNGVWADAEGVLLGDDGRIWYRAR